MILNVQTLNYLSSISPKILNFFESLYKIVGIIGEFWGIIQLIVSPILFFNFICKLPKLKFLSNIGLKFPKFYCKLL